MYKSTICQCFALLVAIALCMNVYMLNTPHLMAHAYAVTSSVHLQLRNYTYTFEEYMTEYGKRYQDHSEYEMRRALFEERLEEVRIHNEDPHLSRMWRKGINHFSDHTDTELRMARGYDSSLGNYLQRRRSELQYHDVHTTDPSDDANKLASFPRELDWRKTPGVLTAIKEQGNCGSCWAFAAVATIESRWFLATGESMALSVQDVVSCAKNPHKCGGTGGCNGATSEIAYQYVKESGGLPADNTSLQSSIDSTDDCPEPPITPRYAQLSGYSNAKKNDLISVLEALQSGPVGAAVDASNWSTYESGIFRGCDPDNIDLNHAVQLVGYGIEKEDDGTEVPYWIIRNSWGPFVGENGYVRIYRELENPKCGTDYKPQDGMACEGDTTPFTACGTCGVLYDINYPNIASSKLPTV